MSSPGWRLVTFGAGLPNWRGAAERLGQQARTSGWFSNVDVVTDHTLARDYPHFFERHQRLLRPTVRGFGYWIWKPFLIRQAIAEARASGDLGVVYLDAGFELNTQSSALKRLNYYRDQARAGHGLFAMHLPGHLEYEWTRLEVLEHTRLPSQDRLSPQIQATPFFAANSFSEDFAAEWLRLCTANNYRLVNDGPSSEKKLPGFKDHRHDQSIFSCLAKQAGTRTIPDETYWAPDWRRDGTFFPLWAMRNRTRINSHDRRLRSRVIRWGEKVYSRGVAEIASRRR